MTLKEEMYKTIQDLANLYRKSIPSNVRSVNNYLVDKIYNSSAPRYYTGTHEVKRVIMKMYNNKEECYRVTNEKHRMYKEIYNKFCEKYNNDNKNISKILEEILNNKASSFFISKSMIIKIINKKL